MVWAKDDEMMPLEHGRELVSLLPQGRLVVVDDSKTLVPFDRPDVLVTELRRFIRDPAAGLSAYGGC